MKNAYTQKILKREMSRKEFLTFFAVTIASTFGIVGVLEALLSHAATPTASLEAEKGALSGNATPVNDGTASAGGAVKFNSSTAITHGSQLRSTFVEAPYNTSDNVGHKAYTGYTSDAALTKHTSDMLLSSLTTAGGTLTKHWFNGNVTIDIPNVTFVGCRFDTHVDNYSDGTNNGARKAFSVSFCTVNVLTPDGTFAVGDYNYTASDCVLMGNTDGIWIQGNSTVTRCIIRNAMQDSSDHNDGMQAYGGSGTLTTINMCNINGSPLTVKKPVTAGANSAIQVADASRGEYDLLNSLWLTTYAGAVSECSAALKLQENASYRVIGNIVQTGYNDYLQTNAMVAGAVKAWSGNTKFDSGAVLPSPQ